MSREQEARTSASYFRREFVVDEQLYSLARLSEILDIIQTRGGVKGMEGLLLSTFQTHIIRFFHTLDESGISALLGREEISALSMEYTYSESKTFQDEEKLYLRHALIVAESRTRRRVQEPRISAEAWNVFVLSRFLFGKSILK